MLNLSLAEANVVILVMAFIILALVVKNSKEGYIEAELKSQISKKDYFFFKLSELMWDRAVFVDSKGKTGEDRDEKEITRLWEQYHQIVREYRGF